MVDHLAPLLTLSPVTRKHGPDMVLIVDGTLAPTQSSCLEERMSVSKKSRRSFTPEFKEETAKSVVESTRPVAAVAREIGVSEQTLRNWVNAYRRDHAADEPPLTISERAWLRELEKEVRELRAEREFLGKRGARHRNENLVPRSGTHISRPPGDGPLHSDRIRARTAAVVRPALPSRLKP
ncbi:transposase [Amycolatopsis lurida]|uniref:transposase n=1 Tax=Amycolatopsis lurida TaxID=31959 RepID=UPI000B847588|nr:transposase [Amycolatopsis lurida]